MSTDINLSFINAALEELGADFQIKPVGKSDKLYWLYDEECSYSVKTTASFVHSLEAELAVEDNYLINLHPLFGDNFIAGVKSTFTVYPGIGFVAKDYAELYIAYQSWWGDIAGPAPFAVGNTQVWVSNSSSLHQLLNERYNEYDAEMDRYTTLCLKGTSSATLEDDISYALYYLDLLMPVDDLSYFDDTDRLRIQSIKAGPIFAQEKHQRMLGETLSFSKSVHPIPVRYFVQAERLAGEVSILYYYKVLEYFFGLAWRKRIMYLVSKTSNHKEDLQKP